ncbi:MAG: hypothetical protein DDT21_01875 [Syntrophomonadaceae bacterium]|nr:hypothetical protein [Bacillota bacterium]
MKNLLNAIGKTISETNNLDWFGYWPEVGKDDTIIIAIHEMDAVPEDAILFWEDGEETDGTHGFDFIRLPY